MKIWKEADVQGMKEFVNQKSYKRCTMTDKEMVEKLKILGDRGAYLILQKYSRKFEGCFFVNHLGWHCFLASAVKAGIKRGDYEQKWKTDAQKIRVFWREFVFEPCLV